MSERRKDSRGRNLRDGESQMPDGRYRYRYTDANGKRQAAYSWRLVSTDRPPPGKKDGESLREKEAAIAADQRDGIDGKTAAKMTVAGMFARYMDSRRDLKESTVFLYNDTFKRHISGSIGNMRLSDVRFSDVKRFYNALSDSGLSVESVGLVHKILNPVFALAVRDGIIRTNPASGMMQDIKRLNADRESRRHALTVDEQAAFVDFLTASRVYSKWKPLFTFLLGTGCRIGEAIGLTWSDCDMEKGVISISHALIYKPLRGAYAFHITAPKTARGCRIIPMLPEVKQALLHERIRQMTEGVAPTEIDGYTGFVFTNTAGKPLNPTDVNAIIRRALKARNGKEIEAARRENREPLLIRPFSAHDLRHTFCTRFCENETNIKAIQEIMGHSDIKITMDIYAEATEEKKRKVMEGLNGKIKIS